MKSFLDFFMSKEPENYKYKRGQIVYFYDSKYNNIKPMKINHRMSGWDSDDWEYYHCSCTDELLRNQCGDKIGNNVFGHSVCEISQKDLFSTKEEAEKAKNDISTKEDKNKNGIRVHDLIKKFNYDGIDHSFICIAQQAKNVEDNPVLSNKAIELLNVDKRRQELMKEFASELTKINFPTWD